MSVSYSEWLDLRLAPGTGVPPDWRAKARDVYVGPRAQQDADAEVVAGLDRLDATLFEDNAAVRAEHRDWQLPDDDADG